MTYLYSFKCVYFFFLKSSTSFKCSQRSAFGNIAPAPQEPESSMLMYSTKPIKIKVFNFKLYTNLIVLNYEKSQSHIALALIVIHDGKKIAKLFTLFEKSLDM